MRIDGLPTELTQASNASTSGGGQDQFLKLFLTQLQNQDPLSPQDSAAFVSQLAQFSSVEQLAQVNQRIASLEMTQAGASRASLADLVGRTVTASADAISIDNTQEAPPLFVQLDSPAKDIEVTIKDSSGNIVKTISVASAPSGDLDLHWDGTGQNGAKLPPGEYSIEVSAKNTSGQAINASPILKGVIEALNLSNGNALFEIGGILLPPGAITSVIDG
jgi:flagellar basal-body rod modification protein FlgD